MKRFMFALALSTIAAPALAQNACVSPPPVGDPCMVGHWIGENTAPERLRSALQGIAPDSVIREIEASMSPVLGISIYNDGFYHTLPFHHSESFTDTEIESGDVTDVRLDLAVPTQVGFINGTGGRIEFCDAGSAPAMFSMTTGGGGYAGSAGKATPFEPNISYSCSGRSMTMNVQLPAPVGTVDYYLTRIPESSFDETFGLIYDSVAEAREAASAGSGGE